MGKNKKKKPRNTTVYCATEGMDEVYFLNHLKGIYSDLNSMKFPDNPTKGGNPDKIVNDVICNVNKYDRAFAWFDEDKDFSNNETINKLAKCWNLGEEYIKKMRSESLNSLQKKFNPKDKRPILIISQPVCFEGFILRVLGKRLPHQQFNSNDREKQVADFKNSMPSCLRDNPFEYYKQNLIKDALEEKRNNIYELDLLIKMVSKI